MDTDYVGRGWGFPLGVGATGGIDLVGGDHKLRQSMRLILLTYPGERARQPEFGSRLRDHVFAPTTEASLVDLATEVRAALDRWEPRVTVTSVRAVPDHDVPSLVLIEIDYTVPGGHDERSVVFPFHSLPTADDELVADVERS